MGRACPLDGAPGTAEGPRADYFLKVSLTFPFSCLRWPFNWSTSPWTWSEEFPVALPTFVLILPFTICIEFFDLSVVDMASNFLPLQEGTSPNLRFTWFLMI